MLQTKDSIREDLLRDWNYIEEAVYPDDFISEYADSAVPVYTNDIIADWTAMPQEYDNIGKDLVASEDSGIVQLMVADLYVYYSELYREVYAEILAEMQECPECGETSLEFRGDWCKDCDKQAQGGE